MKDFRNGLLSVIIILSGIVANAQEVTLPADPAPDQFDFEHRTLIVQYTGTTCSYCYQMIGAIDKIAKASDTKDLFHLAVCHDFRNDPMNLTPNNLNELYPITDVPRALIGFTEKFTNKGENNNITHIKKCFLSCFSREVKAGIAVNSKLEGNTLTVKAQLKAAAEGEYTIGCWLLEDSIYDAQANMGMINHNNVIRYAEKARGNELGAVKAGETADTEFTIPLQDKWKKENCHLLVFACVYSKYRDVLGTNYEPEYIINNVITAPLNTAVPYKYLSNSAIDEIEANDEIQVVYWDGQLDVTATSPIEEVAIYNMQGRLMLQLTPATDSISLSLDDLPAGIYTVRVGNTQTIKTKKIIKQ